MEGLAAVAEEDIMVGAVIMEAEVLAVAEAASGEAARPAAAAVAVVGNGC